jgi:hypothetical protein
MRAGITTGYVVGAHSAFYRVEEEGSGRVVGSQEAAGGKCDFNGAGVMVLKRNREEGKRGAAEVIGWRLFEGAEGGESTGKWRRSARGRGRRGRAGLRRQIGQLGRLGRVGRSGSCRPHGQVGW